MRPAITQIRKPAIQVPKRTTEIRAAESTTRRRSHRRHQITEALRLSSLIFLRRHEYGQDKRDWEGQDASLQL